MTDKSKDDLKWSIRKLFGIAIVSALLTAGSRGMGKQQSLKYVVGFTLGLTATAVFVVLQAATVVIAGSIISLGTLALWNRFITPSA